MPPASQDCPHRTGDRLDLLAESCWRAQQDGPGNPYYRTVLVGGTAEDRSTVLEDVTARALESGWQVLVVRSHQKPGTSDDVVKVIFDEIRDAPCDWENVLLLVEELHTCPAHVLLEMMEDAVHYAARECRTCGRSKETVRASTGNPLTLPRECPTCGSSRTMNVGWLAGCAEHHTDHLQAIRTFAEYVPIGVTGDGSAAHDDLAA